MEGTMVFGRNHRCDHGRTVPAEICVECIQEHEKRQMDKFMLRERARDQLMAAGLSDVAEFLGLV